MCAERLPRALVRPDVVVVAPWRIERLCASLTVSLHRELATIVCILHFAEMCDGVVQLGEAGRFDWSGVGFSSSGFRCPKMLLSKPCAVGHISSFGIRRRSCAVVCCSFRWMEVCFHVVGGLSKTCR